MPYPTTDRPTGLLAPAHRFTTIGIFALGFLVAFEALAVTTAMPVAARDLHGTALYGMVFTASAAAGLVGTAAGGAWSDRNGPVRPLVTGIALFLLGLLVAGGAPAMTVLIGARLLQGLGAGAISACLYVLVGRLYPEALHPRIFALLAAAWVLPSLVGPAAAGATAQFGSWRWVFLGIVPLVVAAAVALAPVLRGTPMVGAGVPIRAGRIGAAGAAAAALLVLRPVANLPGAARLLALPVLIGALVALRPLLPRGTLRSARGLPSVVVVRAMLGGGFSVADAYLPYLLVAGRHVPPAFAGVLTTVGAVSWAAGSQLQARIGSRRSHRAFMVAGAGCFAAGLGALAVAALTGAAIPLLGAAWLLAGLGIGIAYPRTSTATLAHSTEADQGRNSASLAIADGFGSALALAVAGAATTALGDPFTAAFGLAVVMGAGALAAAPRTGERSRTA